MHDAQFHGLQPVSGNRRAGLGERIDEQPESHEPRYQRAGTASHPAAAHADTAERRVVGGARAEGSPENDRESTER